MSVLRWNAMLGEWVIITPKRANRPFQQIERACPFCPDQPETQGEWSVLTLKNEYPSLHPESGPVPLDRNIVMEAPAYGACKVIITSRNHDEQIEQMNDEHIDLVMKEYARVFQEIEQLPGIEYVFQFENRGKSIGVSLNHPHGQVYAMPFIPQRIVREITQFESLWNRESKCLICQAIENELKAGERIIFESDNFVSLVPFGARLPYEVHIYPRMHVQSLSDMIPNLSELGLAIRDVVQRYKQIFEEVAYVMVFHTRPTTGKYPFWHFHVEFYPPWRDTTRIKYLAGVETGAWTYTNDSTPEEIAKELKGVQ